VDPARKSTSAKFWEVFAGKLALKNGHAVWIFSIPDIGGFTGDMVDL